MRDAEPITAVFLTCDSNAAIEALAHTQGLTVRLAGTSSSSFPDPELAPAYFRKIADNSLGGQAPSRVLSRRSVDGCARLWGPA